jgi:hypothetical protein
MKINEIHLQEAEIKFRNTSEREKGKYRHYSQMCY